MKQVFFTTVYRSPVQRCRRHFGEGAVAPSKKKKEKRKKEKREKEKRERDKKKIVIVHEHFYAPFLKIVYTVCRLQYVHQKIAKRVGCFFIESFHDPPCSVLRHFLQIGVSWVNNFYRVPNLSIWMYYLPVVIFKTKYYMTSYDLVY